MARRVVTAIAVLGGVLAGGLVFWTMGGPLGLAATPTTAFPTAQQLTTRGVKEHEVVSFWSPWNRDGTQLFYTVIKSNPEIWAVDIARHQSEKLTGGLQLAGFPVFDRALERIVYFAEQAGNFDVWTIDRQGKERKRLTTDPAPDVHPTWSPDGTKIAFASTRSGEAAIWIMEADGSNAKQITTDGSGDWIPSWSPDGAQIVYSRGAADREMTPSKFYEVLEPPGGRLWIVDLYSGAMRRLTNEHSASDWNPMWSPDATRIAFASRRSGNPDIWLINSDGTGLVQLTDNPAADYAPTWSPDGAKIAFTSKRTGSNEVWILDLNSVQRKEPQP